MKPTTTTHLLDVLQSVDDMQCLQTYLEQIDPYREQLSFPDYMEMLIKRSGTDKASVISRAGIERTYGYQILNGRRTPGRDKVLLLCLALHCSLEDTQKALQSAGASVLYPKRQRDSVIIFAISKQLEPMDANALLEEFHLPLLL